MEIRNHKPAQQAQSNPLRTDLTRSNREGIERALEQVELPGKGDRVDLSSTAHNLTKDLQTATEETSEHRERVAELMEQYREGSLNTPERIERAAEGLLGSDS